VSQAVSQQNPSAAYPDEHESAPQVPSGVTPSLSNEAQVLLLLQK
jgi:hypothetical protein